MSVTLTFFLGEIYNHKQLRAQLEQKGYVFETHSDCEVIKHLVIFYFYFFLHLFLLYNHVHKTNIKELLVV